MCLHRMHFSFCFPVTPVLFYIHIICYGKCCLQLKKKNLLNSFKWQFSNNIQLWIEFHWHKQKGHFWWLTVDKMKRVRSESQFPIVCHPYSVNKCPCQINLGLNYDPVRKCRTLLPVLHHHNSHCLYQNSCGYLQATPKIGLVDYWCCLRRYAGERSVYPHLSEISATPSCNFQSFVCNFTLITSGLMVSGGAGLYRPWKVNWRRASLHLYSSGEVTIQWCSCLVVTRIPVSGPHPCSLCK